MQIWSLSANDNQKGSVCCKEKVMGADRAVENDDEKITKNLL